MRKSTDTLTPAQVYRFAVDFCQPHLKFHAVGKVAGEVILSVLFAAAARLSSIHETCRRLDKAPCEETLTAALYPQLIDVDGVKRRVNAAFAAHLPRALRRCKRPFTIAVDLTLIAYFYFYCVEVLTGRKPFCDDALHPRELDAGGATWSCDMRRDIRK